MRSHLLLKSFGHLYIEGFKPLRRLSTIVMKGSLPINSEKIEKLSNGETVNIEYQGHDVTLVPPFEHEL